MVECERPSVAEMGSVVAASVQINLDKFQLLVAIGELGIQYKVSFMVLK